jgi:hypothetical protein
VVGKLDKQLAGLDVPGTVKGFEETVRKVGTAAEGVSEAAASVAQGRKELARSFESAERSIVRTLEELEQALRSARALLDTLERDPSAVLRGKRAQPEGDAP